ncbi:uncharacterized protein TRIVIDRAFT_199731 [Trichoderma virens Gv29-8]|uniref:Uncharacterized protein n=1 Tax=Hypocrea virens (strain Gv29-8 / FGSC 10586) TaxID=413071 RepID=G9MN94_HYPVG|nr:uncharacterized protein TRIVIDRAFT_199731 [Trichoderma virens Gv29-8]EHK23350.1 hypothetical protein TRIVIDRAFT_199731 [Trichoderma virens Gv29-8]
MSDQESGGQTNQEIVGSANSPTTNNIRDNENLLYDISAVFGGPISKSLWPSINSRIRAFLRLNQIEQFRDQSHAKYIDSCKTQQEKMNCLLLNLQIHRGEMIQVALMGTKRFSSQLKEIIDSHTKLYEEMLEHVEEVVEDAIKHGDVYMRQLKKEFKRIEKEVNRQKVKSEVVRRKVGKCGSLFLRQWLQFPWTKKPFVKDTLIINPDTNDGFFFRIGLERLANIAALEKNKELMQKQHVLICLAHDAMVWDPENVFLHEGKVQGRLWTHGLKEEHFRKLDGDEWSVQMKWTAAEGSMWRPKTVHVNGKFGRRHGEQVEWVPIEPGRSDVDFDVEIHAFDDFYDEEEWGERGSRCDTDTWYRSNRTWFERIFYRNGPPDDDN